MQLKIWYQIAIMMLHKSQKMYLNLKLFYDLRFLHNKASVVTELQGRREAS